MTTRLKSEGSAPFPVFKTPAPDDQAVLYTDRCGICTYFNPNPRRLPWPHI
jgi:hypothetical protein